MISPGQAQHRPGFRAQNDSLFFLCRLGAPSRQRKKRLGVVSLYLGRRPRRPCPWLLSGRPSGAPERRTRHLSPQPPSLLFARTLGQSTLVGFVGAPCPAAAAQLGVRHNSAATDISVPTGAQCRGTDGQPSRSRTRSARMVRGIVCVCVRVSFGLRLLLH